MQQLAGEPDLPNESLDVDAGRERGMEHLEGDRPVVPPVTGAHQADVAFATGLGLLLEHVAVAQLPLEQVTEALPLFRSPRTGGGCGRDGTRRER